MLGEKALSLIRELQRTSDVTPPVFNDDVVRQVLEEIKALFEENRRDVDSAEDGQSGLLPAIKLRHYAVLRNKRCVLAYLYNRLQRIRKLRWSFGSLLPADVKYKLSETEMALHLKRGNFRRRQQDPSQISLADFTNPWTFYWLLSQDNDIVIPWVRDQGLLLHSYTCPKCDCICVDRRRASAIDGLTFRCTNNRNHEYSIRKNSFFTTSQFTLQDIFQFIRSFLDNQSLKKCAESSGLDYKRSAVDWASFIRELFKEYFVKYIKPLQLTGEVEIDESHFCRKIKHHRGAVRTSKSVWVFGIVERATNRLILYPVDKRDKRTLLRIIDRHVAKGSRIFSDGWAAYASLNDRGYEHFTVIHKQAFTKSYTNSATGESIEAHTNTIEGAWHHAKRHFVRIFGTNLANFEGHLCEVMYRNHTAGLNRFTSFFNIMKEVYPLVGPSNYKYTVPLFDTWTDPVDELGKSSFWEESAHPTADSDIEVGVSYAAPASVGSEIVCCPGSHRPTEWDPSVGLHPNVTVRKRRRPQEPPAATVTRQDVPETSPANSPQVKSNGTSDVDDFKMIPPKARGKKRRRIDFDFGDD